VEKIKKTQKKREGKEFEKIPLYENLVKYDSKMQDKVISKRQ
jgi:hypothetical protein